MKDIPDLIKELHLQRQEGVTSPRANRADGPSGCARAERRTGVRKRLGKSVDIPENWYAMPRNLDFFLQGMGSHQKVINRT